MKIDLLHGPDFEGEKLAEELEKLGYRVSNFVIEFDNIPSMERNIESRIEADIVVGHCFPATLLIDRFEDLETIAIDPPGIEGSEQKIEVKRVDQKIIWSSVKDSDAGFQIEADHRFTGKKAELAEHLSGIINGKQL